MLVTVVIPTAPYHTALAERAAASVRNQTVPCVVSVIQDTARRGTGWARNQGLAQVQTPYVVFLDADDEIAPNFVERCLAVRRRYRYIYTDWYVDAEIRHAPDENAAWRNGAWHTVTTLIPTAFARAVGGFDETLPAAEDTDFYVKLFTAGYCGQRLAEPLFIYGAEGQRGRAFVSNRPLFQRVMDEIKTRYEGKPMGCCGDDAITPVGIAGEPQAGDVLSEVLWKGNRRERGRVTGRIYPTAGYNSTAWVNEQDVDASPHLWRRVEETTLAPDPLDTSTGGQLGTFMTNNFLSQQPTWTPLDLRRRDTVSPELAALADQMGVRFAPPTVSVPPVLTGEQLTRSERAARVAGKAKHG